MLADAELYRPVELGWQVMLARFDIWDLSVRGKPQNVESAESLSTLTHLLELREVRDLLSLPLPNPLISNALFVEILRRSTHSRRSFQRAMDIQY